MPQRRSATAWFPQPLPCLTYRLLVRDKRQPRAANPLFQHPLPGAGRSASIASLSRPEHRIPVPARASHSRPGPSIARSGDAHPVPASDPTSKAPFIPLRLRGNELNETAPGPSLRASGTPRLLRKSGGPRGAPEPRESAAGGPLAASLDSVQRAGVLSARDGLTAAFEHLS